MRYLLHNLCILILLAHAIQWGKAQEILVFPGENPVIQAAYKQLDHRKALTASDTLALPFFDDFSRNTIYPDSSLWSDNQAYINFSYGVDPISIGVATLDAIDASGVIYPQASNLTFEADHLTSKPINLDYPPSAGIFLSFYFQPQGIADRPETNDSLVLLFYKPLQQDWDTIWHHPGDTLTPFTEVILPVSDTAYLHAGFRFRFVNFASLTGNSFDPGRVANCDFWNIDYVLLDKGRFDTDTLPRDVSFTQPLTSLLKTYEAMPWKHFRQTFLTEMGSTFPITYRNNDSIIRNVTREFRIYDLYEGALAYSSSGGASNTPCQSETTYNAPLIYTFNSSSKDSALFELKSFLVTDDFDPKINDTVTRLQVFGDEFAYDDGSPEAGYGLSGNGMEHASFACKFHSYLPDTLNAVRIWFNHAKDDANLVYLNLMVWKDSSDIPGTVIYRQDGVLPVLDNNMAGFVTFTFDSTIVVDGDFFVGWEQVTSTFLNVGFDLNRDKHNYARINTSGAWSNSTIAGTVMIRPVFGKSVITFSDDLIPKGSSWSLYPNPASRMIHIQPPATAFGRQSYTLNIYSLTGKKVFSTLVEDSTVNLPFLENGIYLVTLTNQQGVFHQSKMIILH